MKHLLDKYELCVVATVVTPKEIVLAMKKLSRNEGNAKKTTLIMLLIS
jgi:hypothetical protein